MLERQGCCRSSNADCALSLLLGEQCWRHWSGHEFRAGKIAVSYGLKSLCEECSPEEDEETLDSLKKGERFWRDRNESYLRKKIGKVLSPGTGTPSWLKKDDQSHAVFDPAIEATKSHGVKDVSLAHQSIETESFGLDHPRPSLIKRLCSVAHEVQRSTYQVQLSRCEAQLESTSEQSTLQGATSGPDGKDTDKMLKRAKDAVLKTKNDLEHASSAANIANIQTMATWYVQRLFGDIGLENFNRCLVRSSHRQDLKFQMTPKAQAHEDSHPQTLMDSLLQAYQRLCESAGAPNETYHERLQLFMCFYDQQTALWNQFWQRGSAEQEALFSYWQEEGLTTYSKHTGWKQNQSIYLLAWKWIERKTSHKKSVVTNAIWVSRHIKAMVKAFGGGVLYFMDDRLESE